MFNRDFSRDFVLNGKTAFITGASSGIGLEIARMYAEKGADIIAFDREENKELRREVVEQGREFLYIRGDITEFEKHQEYVDEALKLSGRIDILVNSAGVGLIDNAEDISETMWDQTMNVNLKGLFFLTQKIGRRMILEGGGKIISIASQAGLVALDQHVAYGISKAGIIYLTKLLGFEWGEYHIQTNAISPTIVLTPLGEKVWNNEKGEAFKSQIPSGRFAYPQEVAACAVFLASEAANMINGENLVIDGGYTIR